MLFLCCLHPQTQTWTTPHAPQDSLLGLPDQCHTLCSPCAGNSLQKGFCTTFAARSTSCKQENCSTAAQCLTELLLLCDQCI